MDIGTWGPRRSYVVPTVTTLLGTTFESEHGNGEEQRKYVSVAGQLQAIGYIGRSAEIRYIGAMRYDSEAQFTGAPDVTQLHGANFSYQARAGSWNLLLNDQAQYSKGSLLNGTGMEGMGPVVTRLSEWSGNQGIQLGSVGLQAQVAPDQSIISLNAGRISNSALVEIDRLVGNRSLVTGSAFYGLLHFDSSGLTDGWQSGAFAGYEHAISDHDRLGGLYGYTQLGFPGSSIRFDENYGSFMYARSLTGQLAFELGAGPQWLVASGVEMSQPGLDWQGRGSLTYSRKLVDLRGSAMRTITGGSGILNGAMTNLVEASVTHRMSRSYYANYGAALAHNTGIVNGERYNNQYVSATLMRNATRGVGAFVTYTLQQQQAPGCVSGCSFIGLRQLFGVGISWGTRPIGIR